MAFDTYETSELIEVARDFEPVPSFFLNTFFGRQYTSQSEWIEFDDIDKSRRLAPFVAPNNQGQPMLHRGTEVRRFKPAYIKPKDPIDPARLLIRQAGESHGGDLTLQQREDAIIVDTLREHDEMIRRRWEWMACQAVKFGQVTVEGDNYPSRTVSFGRDPANNVTLTGGAQWQNKTTATPIADVIRWSYQVRRSGRAATRLIMGTAASSAFFATDEVQRLFDVRRGTTMGQDLEQLARLGGEALTYHGTLPGTQIGVYTYSEVYEDNMGEEQQFMEDNEVLLTGDPDGIRCFGAIMDRKAGWRSMPIFPKMWEQEDPSGLFLMTQSAPLMVPLRPNAIVHANVMPAS